MSGIRRGAESGMGFGWTLALLAALASGCSDARSGAVDGEFGGTPPTDEELATYPKALPATAFVANADGTSARSDLPASFVIPESTLPPVQAQGTTASPGSPGSCEVWSAGYAMGSYAANLTNQGDIKNLASTVSAAYVYVTVLAEEMKPCGEGTSPAGTLNYLVDASAPSLASIPYYPVCECPSGSDQCLDAITLDQSCPANPDFCTDLSIGSWSGFAKQPASQTLELIKTWIAQRLIVQMTIVVPLGFGAYTSGVFDAPTSCPSGSKCTPFRGIACAASSKTNTGCAQHGVAIVGYDDGLGAIKIQNSFGPGWGEQGYMWMSYATFEAIYLAGTIAFAPPASGSTAAAGLATTSGAADRGFQWVERRAGEAARVHLIFASTLPEPVRAGTITITAPDGTALRHDYGGHSFRRGHHYVSRTDGSQFEAGSYAVRLEGTTRAGGARTFESRVEVALAPGEALPAAPPGDGVTGTNGEPVQR